MCAYKKPATNTRTSASKKSSSAKKTTTRKSSSSAKPRRKSAKKPKVYVPANKAIVLGIGVIAVCVLLLLAANIYQEKKKAGSQEPPSITQRFEDEKTPSQKEESKTTAKTDEKKSDSKKDSQKNGTKTDSKKTESNKTNTGKTDSKKDSKSDITKTDSKTNTKTDSKTGTQTPANQNQNTNQNTISTQNPEIASIRTDTKTEVTKPEPQKPASKFNFPAATNKAQLIFVFDDGGQSLSDLEKFLALPFPITVAVLPQIAHSKESAEKIRKSGNEVMLHQPMQAVNAKINPGPGAITPQMSENEIISTLFTNINEIGPIEGMNNHEGSAITADAEKMAVILKMASENGIFFLDSRTNVETQVPYVAHELGYSWYERNIFLDNEKTRANALSELNKGLALANKNGSVIMIGHIWSADFLPALLKEAYPELVEKGYTFSVVSKSKAKKW